MLGGDGPLSQSLAGISNSCVRVHTLGYREEQPIVQTIAQDVSQERKTPAALAWSSLYSPSTVRTIRRFLKNTHSDASSQVQQEDEARVTAGRRRTN
jgi:hypothetical protein